MMDLNGVDSSGAFPEPFLPADLERLVINTTSGLNELAYLLSEARSKRSKSAWIVPLSRAIARNKKYLRLQRLARNARAAVPGWLRSPAGSLAKRFFAQAGSEERVDPADGDAVAAAKVP